MKWWQKLIKFVYYLTFLPYICVILGYMITPFTGLDFFLVENMVLMLW